MNKNDLKGLVKECLLEILMEGVGTPRNMRESTVTQSKKPTQASPRKTSELISYAPKSVQAVRPPVVQHTMKAEHFRELASGNDVMASIFADTASSGLVESLASGLGRSPSNPTIDTGVDPNAFDGSGNWAHLAFSDVPNSRRQYYLL